MSTDEAEGNRALIRAAFDAWRDGRAPITDVLAPEVVWRIEGRSAAAGEYADRQAFVDEVLAPFAARFAQGERFRPNAVRTIVTERDVVVVVWDGHGVANDGCAYDNSYAWSLRLAGGRVIDGAAFYDSIAFDDLWSRVQP